MAIVVLLQGSLLHRLEYLGGSLGVTSQSSTHSTPLRYKSASPWVSEYTLQTEIGSTCQGKRLGMFNRSLHEIYVIVIKRRIVLLSLVLRQEAATCLAGENRRTTKKCRSPCCVVFSPGTPDLLLLSSHPVSHSLLVKKVRLLYTSSAPPDFMSRFVAGNGQEKKNKSSM